MLCLRHFNGSQRDARFAYMDPNVCVTRGEHAITVIGPRKGHEVVLLTGLADDFVNLGERRFGKKQSCFRADQILIESEHSMAREDKDGSDAEMEFMAMSLMFCDGVSGTVL